MWSGVTISFCFILFVYANVAFTATVDTHMEPMLWLLSRGHSPEDTHVELTCTSANYFYSNFEQFALLLGTSILLIVLTKITISHIVQKSEVTPLT